MKKCLFILLSLLTFQGFAQENIQEDILDKIKEIKWPSDHVTDQVGLFPFGEEIKYNFFLERFLINSGIFIQVELRQSLAGSTIDSIANEKLELLEQTHDSVILFFLSLADRKFKILKTDSVSLEDEQIEQLVKVTIPSLRAQKFTRGIRVFLQSLIYQLDDQSLLIAPNISEQNRGSRNILIFFSSLTLLIFLLGHKLRRSLSVKDIDPLLKKNQASHIGVFWK